MAGRAEGAPETWSGAGTKELEPYPTWVPATLAVRSQLLMCKRFPSVCTVERAVPDNISGAGLHHHCPSSAAKHEHQQQRAQHTHTYTGDQSAFQFSSLSPINSYICHYPLCPRTQAGTRHTQIYTATSAHTLPLVRQCHATQPPTGWWLPFPVRPGTRPGNLSERPVLLRYPSCLTTTTHSLASARPWRSPSRASGPPACGSPVIGFRSPPGSSKFPARRPAQHRSPRPSGGRAAGALQGAASLHQVLVPH